MVLYNIGKLYAGSLSCLCRPRLPAVILGTYYGEQRMTLLGVGVGPVTSPVGDEVGVGFPFGRCTVPAAFPAAVKQMAPAVKA